MPVISRQVDSTLSRASIDVVAAHSASHQRRAGSSGGGGGGGGRGGSVSSSGSSSSSGRASGSSSSSGRSGTVTSGSGRGQVFGSSSSGGTASRSPYGYGYGRPITGGPVPGFGFWPVYWTSDDDDPAQPSNDTRPGGPLLAAAVQPSVGGASPQYLLYGDTNSVQAVLPAVLQTCQAVNGTVPAELAANTTLQSYRDDSFELLSYPGTAAPAVNATFVQCLNQTVGSNLPIGAATTMASVSPAICLVSLAVGLRMLLAA